MVYQRNIDSDSRGDALFKAVTAVLDAEPAGLGEYELLRQLHDDGFFAFLGASPWDRQALFDAHFLLFHVLYRLRDRARESRDRDLEITPLRIRWLPYEAGQQALDSPDTLRDYYLDLGNLEATSAQDVDELIASFWLRFSGQEQRAQALSELGLQDPVDDATIKQAYRQLAMQHHPDRGGDTERLQAINAAMELLQKTSGR